MDDRIYINKDKESGRVWHTGCRIRPAGGRMEAQAYTDSGRIYQCKDCKRRGIYPEKGSGLRHCHEPEDFYAFAKTAN